MARVFESRRRLLKIGGLGMLGLDLPRLLCAEDTRTQTLGANDPAPLESCILIFYYGGPSHIDTWDMKPDAPAEVRGEFQPIATSVPGIQLSEHLPHCAQVMDRLSIVRSMHHTMRNHNSAAVEALCGRTPLGGDLELLADDALSFPCYGSVLSYAHQSQDSGRAVPPHVALPHMMRNVVQLPGQTAGFLGPAFNPFQIEADPSQPDFRVGSIDLPEEITFGRLSEREQLLATIDRQAAVLDAREDVGPMHTYYDRALRLLRSQPVRDALDLNREDATTREAYGPNKHGQSVLLARRLVEAGVRFVTVFDGVYNGQDANWDSHAQVFARHRDHLLPPADRALAALVRDLEARGRLDSTLVVALGEFGRTPRINGAAGRDHWPDCYSVVLAGGGTQGGGIYGASDKLGAKPQRDPVTPGALAATLLWRFGIDPDGEMHDSTGRPYRLADGKPLHGLFQLA